MKKGLMSGAVALGAVVQIVGLLVMPAAALANAKGVPNNPKVITPVSTGIVNQNLPETPAVNGGVAGSGGVTANVVTPAVARLDVFADPTSSPFNPIFASGPTFDGGTHAFITVKNVSSATIQIGSFLVPAGGTVSVGTWGNKPEHTGLWYDLEEKFINTQSAYPGRISIGYLLTQAQLNNLNNFIIYRADVWTPGMNCAYFATYAWNVAVDPVYDLYPGTGYTPITLANAMKSQFPSYVTNAYTVPYNYYVYYAQGAGTPVRSSQF